MTDQEVLAQKIIDQVVYIALATVSEDGQPWNTPVFCAHDEDLNFYWASSPDSQHSKNIKKNRKVFAVIYNSSAEEGTGDGVYIKGSAAEIADKDEAFKAVKLLFDRKNKPVPPLEHYFVDGLNRIYKLTPNKFWINSFKKNNGQYIDGRIELNLN